MNEPTSRLLRRLNAQVVGAVNPHKADCFRAERACFLARQGRFGEARRSIEALRSRYAKHPDAEMSTWLNLAEGLLSHFAELGSIAHDKVMRAHALSAATGLVQLNALAAAWLAQMDFAKLDADKLALHVSESLRLSDPKHHSARTRACLVVAQALHLAGRWDLASPWYTRTRWHATEEGDDLSISALMHNMVSMRLDHFRQVTLTGRGDAREGDTALIGLKSSINFDSLIGTSTLESVRPLMRARFLSLQQRTSEALLVYEGQIRTGVAPELSRLKSDVLSDIAWCRLLQGDIPGAQADALAAEESITAKTQVDDRAATHSRLAALYRKSGHQSEANRHEQLAAQSWREFSAIQTRFVNLLGNLTESGDHPA